VRKILEALQKAGVHLKPEKCEFHKESVKYLGLIIGRNGVSMDPRKVEAIQEWGIPANVHDVRAFLGFANFYRRFILGYSGIVGALTKLTKKDLAFKWT
jgi:hypothetical protein